MSTYQNLFDDAASTLARIQANKAHFDLIDAAVSALKQRGLDINISVYGGSSVNIYWYNAAEFEDAIEFGRLLKGFRCTQRREYPENWNVDFLFEHSTCTLEVKLCVYLKHDKGVDKVANCRRVVVGHTPERISPPQPIYEFECSGDLEHDDAAALEAPEEAM